MRGYGAFHWSNQKGVVTAHRASWSISYNKCKLPASNLHVMHKCDNKICVNPKHLEIGTASKNERDAFERFQKTPRRPILNKYCKRNHRRTHKNTTMKKDGNGKMYPICKICLAHLRGEASRRSASAERTRRNTLYMREYRARKKLQSPISDSN